RREDAAGVGWDQDAAGFARGGFVVFHGGIAGAKGDQVLCKLFDSGTATYGLVIDLRIRRALGVLSDPALIKRGGESCASTLKVGSGGRFLRGPLHRRKNQGGERF